MRPSSRTSRSVGEAGSRAAALNRKALGLLLLDGPLRDLRYVLRTLRRAPGFAAIVVTCLALGIGANAAIFTLVDHMLLRVLPVPDPGRLVLFKWHGSFIGGSSRGWTDSFSYPAYVDLRDENPGVFTGIAARHQESVDVEAGGPAQRAVVELVSGNYFAVLGVGAAIGRTLTPEDDRVIDASPYVVLGYEYWQRRFGGDPSVLNRTIDVNSRPMTVVGVTQRAFGGFEPLSPSDLYVPMAMKSAVTPTWDDRKRRDSIWLKIFARMRPGVAPLEAATAMALPYRHVLQNDLSVFPHDSHFSQRYLMTRLELRDASQGLGGMRGLFAKPLEILFAMVGALLLIACVNVASLLITRVTGRQKELAIRLSLGAARGSLIRLLMTETLVIAIASGALGLLLSYLTIPLLLGMLPYERISSAIPSAPDWQVFTFTGGLALLTALAFGIAPGFLAGRTKLAPTLKTETGASSLAVGQARLRKLLIAGQVALSLLLLIGAGLFARSLHELFAVDSGMETNRLLACSLDPSLHMYPPAHALRLFKDLQSGLRGVPGVLSASGASFPLLAGDNWQNGIVVEGYHPGNGESVNAGWNKVMPGFFSTMGVPLLAGREFSDRDVEGAPRVVVVNEAFVKKFFPRESPIGRRLAIGEGPPNIEIVGVVKNLKSGDLRDAARPFTFTPALQDAQPGEMTFYVRSRRDPLGAAREVRQVVKRLDSSLPVFGVKTLAVQIDETHFIDRLFAALAAAFGLLATLLAAMGLYGVAAFAVARRTHEIGIRVALGADRGNVLRLILREVLLLCAAGVVIGVPAALALGRMVESQLYGIKGSDPAVVAVAVGVISVVCALAGLIPARRATQIDPMAALRAN
ncbi:MAG TPA: ABC transporter permease [Thermoanaerobaculia bacterium]|nr:ABC transporter permease [Thermoanaerobaculia bacterium]